MIISIDWLQLHFRGELKRSSQYTFKQLDYSTKVFKSVEDVYLNKEYIASIVSVPRSSVIHPQTVIIKFINKILYSPSLFYTIEQFIQSTGLIYQGITRLDICADFNSFKNGLYPETFIHRFMTLKYKKIGQSKGVCFFEQKEKMHYKTLKFGTGESIISAYLYNKTKELNEVKMKQYIVDKWQASGLDIKKDVWRLEFSIKGDYLSILNRASGALEKPNLSNLQNTEFLKDLFYSLAKSYFRFKVVSADKNISRWKDVELLPDYVCNSERLFVTETGDGSRADKIFLRKLDKMNDEIRNYANFRSDFIKELTCEFAVNKGLTQYYIDKIQGNAMNEILHLQRTQETMYEVLMKNNESKDLNKTLFDEQEKQNQLVDIILKYKKYK